MWRTLILTGLILCGGCLTYSDPDTLPYSADTNRIAAWKQAAHTVNRSIPGNPVAPIADLAIEGFAALVAAASLEYARRKNAAERAQSGAADSLAELVVRQGMSVQALQIASANGVMPAVARHIDQNTLSKISTETKP